MTENNTPEKKVSSRPAGSARSDGQSRGNGPRRDGGRPSSRRPRERVIPDFEQKMLNIRRVTRVVAGGRRFAFSVAMVIGDKNGAVGIGLGKSTDTSLAIQKAFNDAKKHMVKIKLTNTKSIPYDISAKYASARITIMPNSGRGLVVGSAARTVLELAGIKDITARIHSPSKNKLNIARATIKAFEPFSKKYDARTDKKSFAPAPVPAASDAKE